MLEKTKSLFIILSYSQDRLFSLTFCREKTYKYRNSKRYHNSGRGGVGGVGERVGRVRGKGGGGEGWGGGGEPPSPLTQRGMGGGSHRTDLAPVERDKQRKWG
jgi:hypothetical protein